MLIDSNILIYATQPEHDALRRWIVQTLPKAISNNYYPRPLDGLTGIGIQSYYFPLAG